MTGTRVAGVGMTPFGKFPDRSLESLGLEAVLAALDDAQLDIGDVQAVYAGHAMKLEAARQLTYAAAAKSERAMAGE
jgi:acetyl-CoA acyltransferase